MLRLLRPAFTSIPQFSLLSILPSYSTFFGDYELPGQLVLSVAVLMTIHGCFRLYKWRQMELPVLELANHAEALTTWNKSHAAAMKVTFLGTIVAQALLLLIAIDTEQVLATLRFILLLGMLILSVGFYLGLDDQERINDCAIVAHFVWLAQIVALPGVWSLLNEVLHSERFGQGVGLIVLLYGGLLSTWFCIGSMLCVTSEASKLEQDKSKDDLSRGVERQEGKQAEIVSPSTGKEQNARLTRSSLAQMKQEKTWGAVVMVVDLILLVCLQAL